jgi:hypothetical protein
MYAPDIRAAIRFGWLRRKDRTEPKRGRKQETAHRTWWSCRGTYSGVGDPRDILETHVTHTIVAGRVIYRAEA